MKGTLFGESLWDCGSHVIAVRLDDYPIRQCIHEQVTLQRDEDQGELNLDSTQRPLQGAFLIPPVLPVVLICRIAFPPAYFCIKEMEMVRVHDGEINIRIRPDLHPGFLRPRRQAEPDLRGATKDDARRVD